MTAKSSCHLLKAATFVLSAFSTSIPVHQNSLAPKKSTKPEASLQPQEIKAHLRGQGPTAPLLLSSLKEDGVSIDIDIINQTLNALPTGVQNEGLEDEVNDLFKMAALRKSMTKEQFDATPFGTSVQKIYHLIEKVMMPKVEQAHHANQKELDKLAAEVSKCGKTKNSQVGEANKKKALYMKFSPLHKTCRAGEEGTFTEKRACWEEEADKKHVRDLMCKTFDMVAKQVGDQQAGRQIMKKGGSEGVESYVNRVTSTVCGGCVGKKCHAGEGQTFLQKADPKDEHRCGYDPYTCGCGVKCKHDKARDDCHAATKEWETHNSKCKAADERYANKRSACDSLQDQMDDASCKRAVEMKDACESYAECFFDKMQAYRSLETMVLKEEEDRKAEWKGLKRMRCLIGAFEGGKVTNSEIRQCKQETHSTDNLKIVYPDLPTLAKCEVPHHYPNTPSYKADNFATLPALAKGKQDAYECTGLQEISTEPSAGSPKSCKCERVTLNGPYSPGPMVKCMNCLDVRRSLEKNSCPDGTKLFSPRSQNDWKTFLTSAAPLRAPSFIIDITRPQNGCGGCSKPMNSKNPAQRTWTTQDSSAWWLRSATLAEPNGDYEANCYMDLFKNGVKDKREQDVTFNDQKCDYHSKSYYCQASEVNLEPKSGSPDGCLCKLVTLNGKYSAGSLIKCTGCLRVSKSTQKNSCPEKTKLFSPRTREDWKTFIASATPLYSPNWIIDITQGQNGCGGCSKPMASSNPAQATWMTSDHSPWFLRGSKYSEPNGDYSANCYLNMQSAASEDAIIFNDNKCTANSNAYYCQPAVVKKPVKLAIEDPIDDAPSPPPPPQKIPTPEAGGVYPGFLCAGGQYTGLQEKCGHFEDLSESDCWEKCQSSASANDSKECDKKTGVPECVAMVYDKGPPGAKSMCMLHRTCTRLMAPPPEFADNMVSKLKDTYHPIAARFEKLADRRCKGDPYTRPDDEKKGLKDVSETECKEACFSNKWPGSRDVTVQKCYAASYYAKKRYCDFYAEDECERTSEKTGYVTFKKNLPEGDELDRDEEEEEDDY